MSTAMPNCSAKAEKTDCEQEKTLAETVGRSVENCLFYKQRKEDMLIGARRDEKYFCFRLGLRLQ